MHFTSLAIKLANEHPDSLCALEITVVKHNRILLEKAWYITPEDWRFEPVYRRLYPVSIIDLIHTPDFLTIWAEIKPHLEHHLIICHQASLVWHTLCHHLSKRQLSFPPLTFICTMMLSNYCYPSLSNRKLSTLCHYLNLTFHPSDSNGLSRATAELFMKILRTFNEELPLESMPLPGLQLGKLLPEQIIWPNFENSVFSTNTPAPLSPSLTLCGKEICFTGALESMTRSQAVKHLLQKGAYHSGTVTTKTDFVVTNHQKQTTKLSRAQKLIQEGYTIQIIDESTFLALLKGTDKNL